MESTLVLFLGDRETELRECYRALVTKEHRPMYVSGIDEVDGLITRSGRAIVVVGFMDHATALTSCRRVRSVARANAVQILLLGVPQDTLDDADDVGVDDFMSSATNPQEFLYRVRAASIRLRSQVRLLEERDFFRNAARQEEELSSRILDQHMILKEAFRNIEELNRQLERTNDQLERVAKYDILSALLNRMTLIHTMDMEIERCLRTRMPLSGIMLDIDNFKEINDNFGHLCGDEAISEIGRRLRAHLRKYDQAGRYGGEEFFVVLPNTNIDQAYTIADRFRVALSESPFTFDDETFHITASFGIAEYRDGETRENWIARSDRNMYIAKQSGKNAVVAE